MHDKYCCISVYSEGSGWSAAVHTSVPFGLANLESEMSSVQEQMLQHVKSVLPDLPEPIAIKPQKWRYSQVSCSFKQSSLVFPGYGILYKPSENLLF